MLIGDDGKVIQTFTKVQNPHAPGAIRIDAQGRTLLPGLIDAHGHFFGLGHAALTARPHRIGVACGAAAATAAYAAANPGAGWIVGRGWNQELWADKRFPTAADLDAVVAGPSGGAGARRWPCDDRQHAPR